MRSYLFIGNKKCRIYAACGVSQTPILYNFVRTKKSLQLKKGTFFLCRQYWTKCWINTKIMTNIVKEVIVQDAFLQKEN